MVRRTTLGLAGVPRSAPFLTQSGSGGSGSARPDNRKFTRLRVTSLPGRPQTFSAKTPFNQPPRPNRRYTALRVTSLPGRPQTFTAKRLTSGIVGSISLTVTPAAALYRAPRYYTPTDLVLGIRPMGATITVAHLNAVDGSVNLQLRVQATQLRYHRDGAEHALQANNLTTLTPFGFVRYRAWKLLSGQTPLSVTPSADLTYTPAPVRNHQVSGRTTLSPFPRATDLQYSEVGIAYAFDGTSTFSLEPRATITVTRQTTFTISGRVTVSVTPNGQIEKGTGEPVTYQISGSTVVEVIPQGSMGLQIGIIEQHAIVGAISYSLTPLAQLEYTPAPTFAPLGPGERRRLVRIFR